MKVHESPDGLLRRCTAGVQACRFGGREAHFDLTGEQVKVANEARLARQHAPLATLSKGGPRGGERSLLQASPQALQEAFQHLPPATRVEVIGNHVVTDSPARLARDRRLLKASLARHLSPGEAEIQSNDLENWSSRLYHPRQLLVHDGEGRVVGATVYEDHHGELCIHNVRVSGGDRGAGAGTAMLESLKASARAQGKALRVTNMVASAKGFYARAGAEVVDHSAQALFRL